MEIHGKTLAMDARRVTQVVIDPPLTPVPVTPPALQGLIGLQNEVIPAFDTWQVVLASEHEGRRHSHGSGARNWLIVRFGKEIVALEAEDVVTVELNDTTGLLEGAYRENEDAGEEKNGESFGPEAAMTVELGQVTRTVDQSDSQPVKFWAFIEDQEVGFLDLEKLQERLQMSVFFGSNLLSS